jgi:hypothetical protein
MKKWIFLLLVVLSACGGKRETIQIDGTSTPQSPAPGPVDEAGGADVGGGNTIQGKLIEEYQISIHELLEYQEGVFPIMKVLQSVFPELAADFLHIVEARKWYVVPVDLKTLDPLKIGIPYEFKTEQAALHTPEKIFIDRRIWEQMTESSRKYLILHEIIMGIIWIDKHEGLDRCLAKSKRILVEHMFIQNEKFKDEVRSCYRTYPKHYIIPTKFKLTTDDYETVRALVVKLSRNVEKTDWEELKLWLSARSFRKYEK